MDHADLIRAALFDGSDPVCEFALSADEVVDPHRRVDFKDALLFVGDVNRTEGDVDHALGHEVLIGWSDPQS